ncbi:MAG: hypothetical protein CGW95_15290 [Phenylobacterium zucineum]|nr:MAG: hypothetical protein CGW95_15290 [Phenylobacterium zucineum]
MRVKKIVAIVNSVAFAIALCVAATPSQALADVGGAQGQSSADHADQFNGGWDGTTIGLAGRPYVTSLSIDGVSQLSDVPQSPGDNFWKTPVRAVVYAFNTCRVGDQPSPGHCYADPNRIGITLGYGNSDSIGTDFNSDAAAPYGITTSSVIDLKIQLNGFKGALGWTWLNGHPSYWSNDAASGVVEVKFSPNFMPSSQGLDPMCTTIPVSNCSTEQASAEVLSSSLILSVDKTNEVFGGALFATSAAIMGSIELASPINPADPAATKLTYGLAAPHLFAADYSPADGVAAGDARRGALYALLPNSLLQSAFALDDPARVADLLSVVRVTDNAAQGADQVAWTPWTSSENGTDGQLVSITNISFSSPKFEVSLKGRETVGGNPGDIFRKGMKKSQAEILKALKLQLAKGQKLRVSIAKASTKVCSVSGTAITVAKPGKCAFTATVLNSKGKPVAGKTKSASFTTRN